MGGYDTNQFQSCIELWTAIGRYGILIDAMDVEVREIVNGDFYVTFKYPRLPELEDIYNALLEDNEIRFPAAIEHGQHFVIKRVEEIRDGLKVYKQVEALHVAFGLNQYFYDGYIDFAAAKAPEEMLGLLADGTPYTFVVEGTFAVQDIFDFGEKRKLELLQELRELYGAELSFNNYEITFTTRKGNNYGARVRYRHNMKGIRKTSHSMERITRLYGYGKNGLTIEGYGGRTVKYIDSPYLDPNNPYEAKVEFADIEDQGKLLLEMQKHLAKYELPNVSYDVGFHQMEKIDPDFEPIKIREAGDTVTVYDEVLGYAFDARANEFNRFPFKRASGSAVLTNFRQLRTADYIFQATASSKKAISYTSRNAVLKGIKYDDSITLVDGLGMVVSDELNRARVRLGQTGPGEYGMAMYNKAGTRTIWQDADTGNARFQGKITASVIEGGQIIGGDIQGGVITGALIRTAPAGQRIEFSSVENLLMAVNNAGYTLSIKPFVLGSPGIQFSAESAGSYIIQDPSGLSIIGSGTGQFNFPNVSINGWNSVLINDMNVNSEIYSLMSRVAALEARPVYVPPPPTT